MGQRHAPATLYPREILGTHCTGGWVVLRDGLDWCGKSRPHRYSIPGPSSPQAVAILTELSRFHRKMLNLIVYNMKWDDIFTKAGMISNKNQAPFASLRTASHHQQLQRILAKGSIFVLVFVKQSNRNNERFIQHNLFDLYFHSMICDYLQL